MHTWIDLRSKVNLGGYRPPHKGVGATLPNEIFFIKFVEWCKTVCIFKGKNTYIYTNLNI